MVTLSAMSNKSVKEVVDSMGELLGEGCVECLVDESRWIAIDTAGC